MIANAFAEATNAMEKASVLRPRVIQLESAKAATASHPAE